MLQEMFLGLQKRFLQSKFKTFTRVLKNNHKYLHHILKFFWYFTISRFGK